MKKFRDLEKDTCRRMFGQGGGSKSSNGSDRKATNSKEESDEDHISPAELAKIRSLYVERFRQVYCMLIVLFCVCMGGDKSGGGGGETSDVYWNSMFPRFI